MRWTKVCVSLLVLGCSSPDDGSSDSDASGGKNAASGGSSSSGGSANSSGGQAGSTSTGGSATGGASSGGSAGSGTASGGSAGSNTSGGSGGDGPIPHIPGDCSGLAEVGQFEAINPPGIELDMMNGHDVYGSQWVLVNPQQPTMVYVGMDKQGFFRSTDCGSTWTKMNTGKNGDKIGTGAQWSAAIDPTDPEVIYAVNGYGSELGLWKTTNGGTDWDQLFPADSEVAQTVEYTFVSIVSMDPTNHLHLVVSFHGGCKGEWAPACQAETTDGGANWRLLLGPATGNYEGAGPAIINATTWVYAMPFDGLWLTTNSGDSWDDVSPDGVNGPHYQLYHPDGGAYYMGTGQGVLKSDDGTVWSLLPDTGWSVAGLVGNGEKLFGSQQWGDGLFFQGDEGTGANWAEMPTPGRENATFGAYSLGYDPDHHILYGSCQKGGLWRVVTE